MVPSRDPLGEDSSIDLVPTVSVDVTLPKKVLLHLSGPARPFLACTPDMKQASAVSSTVRLRSPLQLYAQHFLSSIFVHEVAFLVSSQRIILCACST